MKLRLRVLAVIFAVAGMAPAADPSAVTIPSISGTLAIDGKPDEPGWQGARVFRLENSEIGRPFPAGGEARAATRGGYLCLSARIPEPDRIVAHSTGRNPNWWSEDVIRWNIRLEEKAARRNVNLSLAVNPAGAYSFNGEGLVLVEASIEQGQWTVEAAIPLEGFGNFGFLDVERVRPARPEAPELRWFWPAPNERAAIEFAAPSAGAAPEFHPSPAPSHTAPPSSKGAVPEWAPATVWTPEQHDRLRVSSMVEASLRERMAAAAQQERREWEKVDSRAGWERFRDGRLAKLRAWLGPWPERTPARAEVTRRADYGDGFAIENLVYESRPHLLVTANLYIPEHPSGKIPAIVVIHSHHAPKTQSELQDLGMTWARAGVAVLVMDQLCAGERAQSQPWPRESYYGRYALGNQLLLAGESLMKWMVWDVMRGIDVLLERPYIDPQRIILLGAVAGGGDPAAVAAALDGRVAAVIPFNFGEAGPEEHYTQGPRGYPFDTAWPGWGEWETTRSLPRSSIDQFFPWFLCASVAPRPFLYSFEIAWPEGVEREPAWARYKKVFELYGARDRLAEVHGFGPFPGPGECTNVGPFLRRQIYPILGHWMNLPVPAAEYHDPLPDAKLRCLTAKLAAERRPMSASAIALETARERLARARARGRSAGELRQALREKLGDIEPISNPAVQPVWERPGPSVDVEAVAITTAPGITLPVLMLRPTAATAPAPVALAIAEGGKAGFLANRAAEISALLKKGVAICLPDLRGTGEIAGTSSRGPGAMGLAATELMLGGTMPGAQLKDARSVFRYLRSRRDIDPDRIVLWGDSFAETNAEDFVLDQSEMQAPGPAPQHQAEPMGPLIAVLTGLYEQSAGVAARGGLVSFVSVLEDRFCHVPLDAIVPGVLDTADIADIVIALGARPVLLEGLVDGRDRLVSDATLRSEYARALGAMPRLTVRERAEDSALADWLAGAAATRKQGMAAVRRETPRQQLQAAP